MGLWSAKKLIVKDSMATVNESYDTIISELISLALPEPNTKGPKSFPGLIATGDGRSVITNERIEAAIANIATWTMNQQPALKMRYTAKEWDALVRKAFGPAIVAVDQTCKNPPSELRNLVEKILEEKPATLSSSFVTMGCTLFYKPISKAVRIGPVHFEPKAEWLARSVANGHLNEDTRTRMAQAFAGGSILPIENGVVSAIGEVGVDAVLPGIAERLHLFGFAADVGLFAVLHIAALRGNLPV